jgi:hypothetical protein
MQQQHLSIGNLEGCRLEATQAVFQSNGFAQWAQQGRILARAGSAMNFWVGDWINFGLRKFCERSRESGKFTATDAYQDALKATGLESETLRNLAWVAGAVPAGVRREGLSWAHHREVAALPAGKQRHWLKLAEGDGSAWTVSQLRQAIRGSQSALDEKGEPDVEFLPWAKPAQDVYRFLKRQDNDEPIENWTDERKRTVRIPLAGLKEMLDRIWS